VPTILLVRHGQASYGGEDYDVLSARGAAQAEALATELSRRGVTAERILSGSLARQRDTAVPAAAQLGREVSIDPRWNEYDIDDILAHHSVTAARPSRPASTAAPEISPARFQDLLEQGLLAWMDAGIHGPAVEPYPAFSTRVSAALAELVDDLERGETALVFTSGGVLAAACVALLALPDSSFVVLNRVAVNTGITKIVRGTRGTTLVSFNEHGHLERDGSSLVTYR
jgi:broad specificity phosphatase PhoE